MKKLLLILMLVPVICFAKPEWEHVLGGWNELSLDRLKVPHGWIVSTGSAHGGIFFYPDENHEWKIDND